jgi:hypothetical protein
MLLTSIKDNRKIFQQLGHPLQQQESNTYGHNRFKGINNWLPVALHGSLSHLPGKSNIGNNCIKKASPQGKEKNAEQYNIYYGPRFFREAAVENINPHMLSPAQGPGFTHQKKGASDHIAQVKTPFSRVIENIAAEYFVADNEGEHQNKPHTDPGHKTADRVNTLDKTLDCFH